MKCCSKLWKKPWSWLHVAKHCSYDDSPPLQSVVCVLSVSVAFVQLVEDPVTQIVDLLVIVIGGLHLQNHKLNSNCIAQPWNHTFCHPRSTVTLWSEGVWIPQLPQNTPPSSHTRPRYSPAPCVRLHAQHYQLLAEMHFFFFFFFWFGTGEFGHFQPCPQTSPGRLCEFMPIMDGLLCCQSSSTAAS